MWNDLTCIVLLGWGCVLVLSDDGGRGAGVVYSRWLWGWGCWMPCMTVNHEPFYKNLFPTQTTQSYMSQLTDESVEDEPEQPGSSGKVIFPWELEPAFFSHPGLLFARLRQRNVQDALHGLCDVSLDVISLNSKRSVLLWSPGLDRCLTLALGKIKIVF